ncbi:MAG: four-carbon acid sugar kinase family protein, partial [Chloroflexota bacterium]
MIVVLADDLTGAAEIGGIAFRYGLAAEIQTVFDPAAGADLIAVDTDTRGYSAGEAAPRVAAVAEQCRRAGVEQVFKKVDSVLRGPVLAELATLLETLGRERALLAPANPSLGRTIEQGQYR